MAVASGVLRSSVRTFVQLMPPGMPEFVYRVILRPAPLRRITNALLVALLPSAITLPEGTLLLNQKDPVVSGALTLGAYEPFQIRVFREQLRPGMIVFDIGANIGLYTLLAGRGVGPEGRVVALEPEPTNAALLKKTIAANTLESVSVEERAASDTDGTTTLHLSGDNLGKHSFVPEPTTDTEAAHSIQVSTVRADNLLETHNLPRVDLIKMDIEGAEPLALKGMDKILHQDHLVLFIEFYPAAIRRAQSDPEAFLNHFIELGFRLDEIDEGGLRLIPITDVRSFAARFKDEQNTNLLCRK